MNLISKARKSDLIPGCQRKLLIILKIQDFPKIKLLKFLSFTHKNVKMLRSTHCAKCFKIKAEYKFDEVGLEDFENGDFLKISFTQPVELIKWTGALSNIYPTDSSKKVLAWKRFYLKNEYFRIFVLASTQQW